MNETHIRFRESPELPRQDVLGLLHLLHEDDGSDWGDPDAFWSRDEAPWTTGHRVTVNGRVCPAVRDSAGDGHVIDVDDPDAPLDSWTELIGFHWDDTEASVLGGLGVQGVFLVLPHLVAVAQTNLEPHLVFHALKPYLFHMEIVDRFVDDVIDERDWVPAAAARAGFMLPWVEARDDSEDFGDYTVLGLPRWSLETLLSRRARRHGSRWP